MGLVSTGSAALAVALGLRHGLDADHLAAIDGLTRWNARERRALAPYCGALFSAGHSGVILIAAVALSIVAERWTPQGWLAPVGAFVSAAMLLGLSALNLRQLPRDGAIVLRAPGTPPLVGLRSRCFSGLLRAGRASHVAIVGALFALSFDALGLAALFASTASPAGSLLGAGSLAVLFAAGMIAVDGANGWWVTRLLNRSDQASAYASRVLTLIIAVVGLIVGCCILLSTMIEPLAHWLTAHELAISSAVVLSVLLGYAGAITWQRVTTPLRRRYRAATAPARRSASAAS